MAMFRRHSTQQLRKPNDTRFCTNFLLVESIKENYPALCSVVANEEWADWLAPQSYRATGEKVADAVLSSVFRRQLTEIVNISEPLVITLRKFDGSAPFVGKVYRAVFDAIEAIRELGLTAVSISHALPWQWVVTNFLFQSFFFLYSLLLL